MNETLQKLIFGPAVDRRLPAMLDAPRLEDGPLERIEETIESFLSGALEACLVVQVPRSGITRMCWWLADGSNPLAFLDDVEDAADMVMRWVYRGKGV